MSFDIARPGSPGLWKDLRHHPGDGHFGGPGDDHDGDFGGRGAPGGCRPSDPPDGPRPDSPADSCPQDDDLVEGPFRVVRPSDMLVLDISLVNLRFDGHRLVRTNPAAPTLVVVTLPPQHVLEQASEQLPATGTVSAVTAGASTLSFSVPATLEDLELSLDSLLDWSRLVPMTVPVGSTKPDTTGTALFQGLPRSVIEFPTRLLITYDEPVDWVGRTAPQQVGGRTALWHARLHGTQEGDVLLRAFAAVGDRGDLPAGSPLAVEDLADIVTLTSRNEQVVPGGLPADIPSAPLRSEQFIVTPLGSSAHLHGAWPPLPASRGLEAYDHITGLGRDQYVRVVRHGRLSTGHESSHVKEFRRVFAAHPNDGIVAFLRREDHIIVKQPEVQYGQTGYTHQGREMPFRTLRITDRATPPIRPPDPVSQEVDGPARPLKDFTAFWVVLQNTEVDHEFTLIGTDCEGRKVSFTMPLVFVPDGLPDPDGNFTAVYQEPDKHSGVPDRHTRELHGQTMAMAQPPAEAPGSTAHAVETLTFGLGTMDDHAHPEVGLPYVSAGKVRVPAVEQFLPKAEALAVTFDPTYLQQSMDSHPAGAYLRLTDPLPLTLGAEKAGGLASPQAALQVITSQAGVVPDVFAAGDSATDARKLIQTAFGGAKLLGLIDLAEVVSDIVKEDLGQLRQLGDDQIEAILKDSQRTLPAPVLRIRDLADGQGKELRYVWKTRLTDPASPPAADDPTRFFVATGTTLTLDARTTRSKDAVDNTTVAGELTGFALNFGDIRVDIADLRFRTGPGKKPDVTASGLAVTFDHDLEFVNTLRSALPSDVIGPGAYVDVQPAGIVAGYKLALPSIALGVLTLTNLTLSAELTIPFDSSPVSFRFSVSEQQHPFDVTVSLFGGGGYFSMLVDVEKGLQEVEGSIEFGGSAAVDVGVAAGGVTIMVGIRFKIAGPRDVQLSGYLRFNGFLSVLGIVTVSVDFYVELGYEKHGNQSVIRGSGNLTVSVRIAFFSKSVSIPFERTFSGSPGDPSFALCMPREPHWRAYCEAYAR